MVKKQKIILNIGTHGDERIGLAVVNGLKKLCIKNGELIINIANERAFKLNKRFIDQDLNRSFPGKKKGNYEEKRAHKLLPLIKSADVVIDIHSTKSELKDALIITRLNKKIREYVEVIRPRYALYMSATRNNTLISYAKIGIAFEYGKDKDKRTVKKIISGIKFLLSHLNMISPSLNKKGGGQIVFFDVYKTIPKPKGAKLNRKIINYTLIKKGQEYGTCGNKKLKAKHNFYPILFGEKNYEDIYGFAAKKINY